MGQARDFFEAARSAQRLIDGALARLEAMRRREGVRAQRYGAAGGRGGRADAMAATDARIDEEARVSAQIGAYRAEVAAAREACEGVRAANPSHPLWADALELRFCEALSWAEVASGLGVSVRLAQDSAAVALDWVDCRGVAAVRSIASEGDVRGAAAP